MDSGSHQHPDAPRWSAAPVNPSGTPPREPSGTAPTDPAVAPPDTPIAPTRSHGRQHLPGLTGLRAIAVAAVVAYHLGYLHGGFIGVDLFFVLSGFLITSLLLDHTPADLAGMLQWWGRRVRRLTPAVAVVVAVVLLAFLTRSGIALDALATLTWWQNWHLIAQGTPYWAPSPSPLRHAWSLSIEEQFYLLWPPILLGLLAVARRFGRSTRFITAVAVLGAGASFAWAAWLASAVDPNLSRIYFGTDTRAGALLIGCAAAAWIRTRPADSIGRFAVRGVIPAALVLVGLSVAMEPSDRWAYTGGLAVAALASLVLVIASTRPGPFSSGLSWEPVQWLGDRSYAIYLWSWPVQVFLQDRFPDLPLWSVAVLTVGVSLPLSSWSRRLVEEPLRRQSSWAAAMRPRRAAWGVGAVVLIALMLFATASTELTVQEEVAKEFEQLPDPTIAADGSGDPDKSVTTTTCVPPTSTTTTSLVFSDDTSQYDPGTVTESGDPTIDRCHDITRVLVVGDSTGRGAANGLKRANIPGLEVWDRTTLGCGLVSDSDDCGDWETRWKDAVAMIDPDVVLVYLGASNDVVEGRDPGFLTTEASLQRQETMTDAIDLLSSNGAEVVWILPATPLEDGVFFCGGKLEDTPCDADWLAQWNADLMKVAQRTGIRLLDVAGWVSARGSDPADRPDGLHLSGPALDDQARWIAGQLP